MSERIRYFDIAPTAAPRQTRRDKFKPSPAVVRYRVFRDLVAAKVKELPDDFFHVVYMIQVPASWSQKKKREHVGHPHLGKPDKDNLDKALLDSVFRNRDDAHVWNTASTKLWAYYPGIIIADDYLEFLELPVDFSSLIRGTWEVYDRTRIV